VTRFDEVWTEDIRRAYAQLAEPEVIRYTRPDRRTLAPVFVPDAPGFRPGRDWPQPAASNSPSI
jgi:hypothetical protein